MLQNFCHCAIFQCLGLMSTGVGEEDGGCIREAKYCQFIVLLNIVFIYEQYSCHELFPE